MSQTLLLKGDLALFTMCKEHFQMLQQLFLIWLKASRNTLNLLISLLTRERVYLFDVIKSSDPRQEQSYSVPCV